MARTVRNRIPLIDASEIAENRKTLEIDRKPIGEKLDATTS